MIYIGMDISSKSFAVHAINERKKRALVALARKILKTVYGVMKSGEFYNPKALMAYTD